ncbi:MAG TPA: hypothetical protein VMB48_15755 [Steroidobacteraceae bacterium]|nr:hypothetical protein [Steroidobacteraceae bacterium]
MAHILIEHSANLRERINLPRFVQAIQQAALATGALPRDAAHTRACEAGRHSAAGPDAAFVHLAVRVGRGGDPAVRRQVCEHIFAAACALLSGLHGRMPLAISVEVRVQELAPGNRSSNVQDYIGHRRLRSA